LPAITIAASPGSACGVGSMQVALAPVLEAFAAQLRL